jgi:hypothetical protein
VIAPLPGHFSQILGDAAEDDFYSLALHLGYRVVRERNPAPGIDFIAEFDGKRSNLQLRRPIFSPDGITAFSVKRGDFGSDDITALKNYISDAHKSSDPILNQIRGGVIVTSSLKTEATLNDLARQQLFCWDVRRMMLYSSKARLAAEWSDLGLVTEKPMPGRLLGSYMLVAFELFHGVLKTKVSVFVDDHDLVLQGDHMNTVLNEIYRNGLKPMIRSMSAKEIETTIVVHSAGLIQRRVVLQACDDFAKGKKHSGVTFLVGGFEFQSYSTAPWTAFLRFPFI